MRPEETAALAASASARRGGDPRRRAPVAGCERARPSRRGGGAAAPERTLCEGLRAGTVRPQWAMRRPSASTTRRRRRRAGERRDWLAATRRRLRVVEDAVPGKRLRGLRVRHPGGAASTLSEYASRAETTAARAAALAAVRALARAWPEPRALETLLLADADAVGAEASPRCCAARARRGARREKRATLRRVERPRRNRNRTGTGTVRSDLVSFSASFALEVASLRVRAAARDGAGDDDGASETEDASAPATTTTKTRKTRNRETEASRWSRARRALCATVTAAAVYSAYEVRREVRRDEDGVDSRAGCRVGRDAARRLRSAGGRVA